MTDAGEKIIAGMAEALSIARGEQPAARIFHRGHAYVPEQRWRDIKTAPTLDRVFVSGWQKRSGNTAGYWWVHEDCTDDNGVPMDHPDALLWRPLPERPNLPPPPVDQETTR